MRVIQPLQPQLNDYSIAEIRFDLKSRDDIPQILRGLQYIYVNIELRNAVFKLLDKHIQPEAGSKNDRPGMDMDTWKIFVTGVLRLDLNWIMIGFMSKLTTTKRFGKCWVTLIYLKPIIIIFKP